jgi:hypothetical protein
LQFAVQSASRGETPVAPSVRLKEEDVEQMHNKHRDSLEWMPEDIATNS